MDIVNRNAGTGRTAIRKCMPLPCWTGVTFERSRELAAPTRALRRKRTEQGRTESARAGRSRRSRSRTANHITDWVEGVREKLRSSRGSRNRRGQGWRQRRREDAEKHDDKPQEGWDGAKDCEAERGRLVAGGATTGSVVDGDATSNGEDLEEKYWRTRATR